MEVDESPHNRMSHKFYIGQLVAFHPRKGSPISTARGAYEILEQLPERDGELQYRIKNAAEQHERIALESELRAF
jgi:integration host factor subunit alpha